MARAARGEEPPPLREHVLLATIPSSLSYMQRKVYSRQSVRSNRKGSRDQVEFRLPRLRIRDRFHHFHRTRLEPQRPVILADGHMIADMTALNQKSLHLP